MQALDGVRRVEPVHDAERAEGAALLPGLVQHVDQHRREVADEAQAVAVDETHRLGRVEARHHHVPPARVHHREPAPEGRDVEQGEGQQVAVGGSEVHRGGGLEVGGDDVGVGEHGAARDHVDRRGGNDRERIVGRDVRPVRRPARVAEPVEPDPAAARVAVDLRLQDHLLEPRPVLRQHLVVRLVDDEGAGPGAFARTGDLARRQPPVEGTGNDPLPCAREVELEVGRGVPGDDEHPVPLREPCPGESGREGVHPVSEGGEREEVSGLGHEGRPAGMAARVAGEEVVDGEALCVHGCAVAFQGGRGERITLPRLGHESGRPAGRRGAGVEPFAGGEEGDGPARRPRHRGGAPVGRGRGAVGDQWRPRG